MNLQLLKENIEGVDIYILDQIVKNRYQTGEKILDAGCGGGRNLKWFYRANFEIHGVDINYDDIEYCKKLYLTQKENFKVSSIETLDYKSNSFNHIICNAVLHFADDLSHYLKMFNVLVRILKPQGTLFIRMASNLGLENEVESIGNGVYNLPDGSKRFLLKQDILDTMLTDNTVVLAETIKTTLVHHKRAMTTLVLKKE